MKYGNVDYGTVTDIQTEGNAKKLICEEGHSYDAKAVIIATGTRPRVLGVPGEDKFTGTSISWCAICDGAPYRGKKVIVSGGGNSAIEESIYLAGMAEEVTIVTLLNFLEKINLKDSKQNQLKPVEKLRCRLTGLLNILGYSRPQSISKA